MLFVLHLYIGFSPGFSVTFYGIIQMCPGDNVQWILVRKIVMDFIRNNEYIIEDMVKENEPVDYEIQPKRETTSDE